MRTARLLRQLPERHEVGATDRHRWPPSSSITKSVLEDVLDLFLGLAGVALGLLGTALGGELLVADGATRGLLDLALGLLGLGLVLLLPDISLNSWESDGFDISTPDPNAHSQTGCQHILKKPHGH